MTLRLLPAAASLAVALAVVCAAPAAHPVGKGPVAAENLRRGTPGWLGPQVTDRSAEVYASQTDAAAGDLLSLHVSTTPAASYRVLVYRLGWYQGIGARLVACRPGCAGSEQGSRCPRPTRRPVRSPPAGG